MEPLKLISQARGEFDLKKIFFKGRLVGVGNDHGVIKGALLTTAKKTPAQVDRSAGVSFENNAQYILAAEKEL